MSARIKPATPAAAISTSASRVRRPKSRVPRCVIVTVASRPSSSSATGRPTTPERPTTQQRTPRSGQCRLRSSSSITACGVAGTNVSAGRRRAGQADRVGSVDVFGGRHRFGDASNGQVRRKRLLEDDPVNAGIVAQRAQARAQVSSASAGRTSSVTSTPVLAPARSMLRAYEWLAASLPASTTSNAERCRARATARRADRLFAQFFGERASIEQSGRHRLARSDR